MKPTKHTPAPWTSTCNDKVTQLIKSGKNEIARISHSSFGCDQDKANANLIAAAPDMLEQLKQILDALENKVIKSESKSMNEIIIQDLKTLIKKAEGL